MFDYAESIFHNERDPEKLAEAKKYLKMSADAHYSGSMKQIILSTIKEYENDPNIDMSDLIKYTKIFAD